MREGVRAMGRRGDVLGASERRVLDYLGDGRPLGRPAPEIATALEMGAGGVRAVLGRLKAKGLVDKDNLGFWFKIEAQVRAVSDSADVPERSPFPPVPVPEDVPLVDLPAMVAEVEAATGLPVTEIRCGPDVPDEVKAEAARIFHETQLPHEPAADEPDEEPTDEGPRPNVLTPRLTGMLEAAIIKYRSLPLAAEKLGLDLANLEGLLAFARAQRSKSLTYQRAARLDAVIKRSRRQVRGNMLPKGRTLPKGVTHG